MNANLLPRPAAMFARRFACAWRNSLTKPLSVMSVSFRLNVAPALQVARADVAHLDADVARDLAADAAGPGLRVRRLEVRVEDVDRVGARRRQRIGLLGRERRRPRRAVCAEQHRQPAAVVVQRVLPDLRGVADRVRATRRGCRRATSDEGRHVRPLVGHRVGREEDRVAFLAEQLAAGCRRSRDGRQVMPRLGAKLFVSVLNAGVPFE